MIRTKLYKVFTSIIILTMLFVGMAYADDTITLSPTQTTGTLKMTLVIKDFATVTTPPVAMNPTYSGSAQNLVTAGASNGGTMLYALGSADVATGSYSTTIPQGTNAGTYYVWYKVSADANHIDSVAASLDVTISKANPTVTPPTAKTGLKYDSTAQALVNAGSVQGGTMNYALGDNATTAPTSEYSTTIPTGTNEGAYYVWYKVIGNSNYNDTTAQCIQVTIELESYAISYSGLENSTGTDSNPTSYTIKSDTITLANPTKNGYTFSGWTGTGLSEKTQTVTISQGSTGNRSYTANWNIITYKISFDLGGGEFSGENPLSYTYESSDIKPNTPTKEGYDFKGWLLSGDESGTVSKDLTIPNGTTGDLEYIAQWTLHFYTLSYDLDGGTVTPENPKNYTIESNDINLNRPTKTGYDFRGWSFDAEISLDVTIPKGSTGDREYKAEWNLITYSISYDLQGGSVTTANPTSYDVTTETFKLTNPTRTGYTFAGWTGTGITGTSTDVTILTGTTGNRDYTATWTAIEYTISYTLNNGSVSGNPTSYTIETETFTLNKPSRNGYQFDGWTGTDLSGKTQTVTITQGTIGDRSYTANFSPIEYTITYELNGGTNNADNPTSYTIESATITLKDAIKNGYTFAGWTGSNGTTPTKGVTIPTNSTGSRNYTANWTLIQYDISFDLGGGVFQDGNPTSYNYETDTFTLTNPTRDGYEFIGWNLEGESELSLNVEIPQGTTGDLKYIANWKVVKYSLSYELNGGAVTPDNPTSYDIETATFTLNNPKKDGYTFAGWTGTSLDVATQTVTILQGTTGNRSYTANWTLNVYTLSYDLDGGVVSPDNPTSYTIESADIKLTRPTKQGYDFVGWSFDVEISLDVTIPKGSTGDREYKAEWNLITYSISYDLQGGSVTTANPTSYDVTTETFKLNNPTRTGYTFAGWTGTGLTEASTDVTIPTGSTDDRSYTATWTAIEYMISYTLNNGNVSGNPDKYTIESEAITLNNPTKNGYQFTGWTGTDLSGKTQTVTIPTSSTGDRTYTANFSPIVYTISYELNGGTLLSGNPVLYTIESSDITLNNPERAGYTFEGWTGTGLTGATKAVTIAGHSTGNKSYTANWTLIQYDLSFDLGGGVFAEGNPTSYNYETQTFTLNNPTREGYEFLGWSVEGIEGLSMDVTIPQGSTDNRKYTANWKATEYTIGYELNGGTVSPDNPTSYTIESDDFKLTNPTKDGYMFDGWTGTSVDVTESKDVTILKGSTGNREYAANWTLNVYTISYDLDGGAVSSDNPTSYTVESADIKLTQPTKLGYAFAGWSFDSEISLDVTIPKGSTGNRKYQATWEIITYTISYELNGGSVTAANRTSYDVTTEMFKLTNPTRTGYTFAGWTGTGITGTSTDVTILTGTTGNRDYTATWTAIEYTISYTLNNGSVSGNPTSYTIETETFTLNKPSRNGYQFDGWTGTDLSGKTQTVTITQGTIGNRSYTANFSPIEYTITYELNGGTNNADNPTSYTIESATITLKAPTRNAYNFSGWTLNGEAISEIAHGSTGNKTLTATWGETKPIISPASYALTVYKGQSSSLTLNATGTNLEWSISGSLPAGMTFSNTENSATISGTPELGTSGSYAITVTASNAGGSASANVTLTIASDFALSGDVEAGTPATITPEGGGSQTTTQTVFRNGAGQTILTADVAITTESEDFEAIVGSAFTTTVRVDVTLNVADSDYDGYEYSMSITGLPEWLKAEGELESTDMLEVGESTHSHEFTLTGTPTVSSDAETLNLTATVKVSGETPMLEASGSKEVKISVTSPEHIPEILQSLSVKISGDETLITDAGTSASITFTADVKGSYSNGQTRTLPSGSYALTWSAGSVEGLSFSDGKLRINESASIGTHEIKITATAVSGDVTGTDSKTVTVTVKSAVPMPTIPVLTCTTPSMMVKKGGTIVSLTVRADITPQEWLRDGELPEGLSGRPDGDKFVISGTVSPNSDTRNYVYAVRARNEAGTSEAMTITITVTGTGSGTSDSVQVPAEEIPNMTDEEIAETIGNKTEVTLTGNVENLSETIKRIETLTDVKTLDLSQVTGVSELKLENTTLESITLEGNQSITKVEINGNETLTALNLGGSKVETVDVQGCKNLTEVNVEGAENLTALNVSETAITALNVKDCANLKMVDAKGCSNLEEVDLEGCESLEYLDVSETAITELNVQDCVNLGTLYCASCGIKDLNLEGCENLNDLDCSNNSLLILNASGFKNLRYLECRHQRAIKPLSRLMNFIDFLFGRGSFGASAADEGADGDLTSYLANVKNLKAYDEAGEEITTEYDPATGEARFSATPYKITYDYDTGFEDVMMDVEVTASESNDKGYAGIGSPGGGCTSVEGIGALVALMMLLVPTSKTKFMK